ncbi:ARM repeat-containing protein [Hypomontagnella monticulosa]|nr:ARM repeat-containing protein [Hypomontagnella monticulosa]
MRYPIKINAIMENISPSSITLPEVERLVQELYKPNTPEAISRIQELLQTLQKSPQGWQFAEGLLGRPDNNAKFFGALTLTVKLNTTENLFDRDAVTVIQKLITFLITYLRDGTASFVIRKVCSTLVAYFIRCPQLWRMCVRHLSYCLETRTCMPIGEVDEFSPFQDVSRALDTKSYYAIVWFAQILADEAEKVDTKSEKYLPVHEAMEVNARDVAIILARGIHPLDDHYTRPWDSISCLEAWVRYADCRPKDAVVKPLQQLFPLVLNCLPDDILYGAAVGLLTELLDRYQSFFPKDYFDALYTVFESEWGQEKYRLLFDEDDDDMEDEGRFGLFLLAAASFEYLRIGVDEMSTRLRPSLAGLLRTKGYPGVDDRIFVPALEHIASRVEDLVDQIPNPPDEDMMAFIIQAISDSLRKIQYPHSTVYNSWDSTERVAFADARKDVAHFLEGVYPLIGRQLVAMFVDRIIESLSKSCWAELEAAAFCLGALADSIPEGVPCDDLLTQVFGSSLFDSLRQGQEDIPVRARKTCLALVERYSDYFSDHPQLLPAALNLLFSAVGDRHLALPSSKSIHTLCSSCRVLLAPEVNAFLEQYGSLRNFELDSLAEERVVGAIATIIQAMPEYSEKTGAFQRLLTIVGSDVSSSLVLSSCGEALVHLLNTPGFARAYDFTQRPAGPVLASEVALQLAIRALRCISSIAKGLQAPSETLIDLESDDDGTQTPKEMNLDQIHINIMNTLVQLRNTFSNNSEVVDVICGIIRAGFSEAEPGPFVFPPQMVTEFITGPWLSRTSTVVNTASVFVTSLSSGSQKKYVGEVLEKLLPWVFGLLYQLSEPEQDPELTQYGLEFARTVMTKRPDTLMSQPANVLEFLFEFAIKVLHGNEPLPKAAAADFWTKFITLKVDDQNTQTIIDNAMAYIGPKLSESLIRNIGGEALRSELDKLSEPFKKLIARHANARHWIEAALKDPAFPGDKATASDKEMFLKKVMSLRGHRSTNDVVRQFWVACRGSNFAYVS